MALFFSMLPIYVFGNLHCLGMCGPLVMMIGKHRYRYYYFLGRTLSFALAGLIAGSLGSVIGAVFKDLNVSAFFSFFFGLFILLLSFNYLFGFQAPFSHALGKFLAPINKKLSLLMLKDQPSAIFLFGFATIFLPCGQTIVVYSACALYCNALTGLMNGALFALITSPSLYVSMQTLHFFSSAKKHYNLIMGCASLFVGVLAICRGMAEMEWIPHLILNPNSPAEYHLVIF